MNNLKKGLNFAFVTSFCLILTLSTFAQTTAFTYQGRFTDSTLPQPTNSTYAMSFKLFDAVSGGNQIGSTINLPSVQVVNGIFTVQLDFGAAGFDGTARFLEIAVGNSILNPRQEITPAPYSITAQNALTANRANDSNRLGNIPANQYVTGQVVRDVNGLNNSVTIVAGSNITITPSGNTLSIASTGGTSGINNQTATQTSANFNIDGNGAANIFNATTQFNIGGNRVLSVGGGNIFAGVNTGTANTSGGDNTFVGTNAGMTNTTGFNNSFFGTDSGRNNTGASNSFFGRSAGFANTTGGGNSFFGLDAGRFNTTGDQNSFFGYEAGGKNTGGINNTFFGNFAGFTNTTGSNNSTLGYLADVGANNLTFATAIGSGAIVSNSNTIALGRVNGSDTVQVFGLGAAGSTILCRNASNQISTCTAGGGGNFINNSTVQQPTSNFNVSGGGTLGGTLSANIVNSATNFRIANSIVFSTPNSTSVVVGQSANHTLIGINSTFFGYKAGQVSNSFSQANTFIGSESGESNTSGGNNSFVGKDSGFFNTSGSFNSFFGSGAGLSNKTASDNSFFGYQSGVSNTTGTRNSFFGSGTGQSGTIVSDNSFFGYLAGSSTTAANNSFFGSLAGSNNGSGNDNTFIGNSSGLVNSGGFQNTFVGSLSGSTNTNGGKNTLVGYQSASTNGSENTIIGSASFTSGTQNTVLGSSSYSTGNTNTVIGYFAKADGNDNTLLGVGSRIDSSQFAVNHSTAIGADAVVNLSNSVVLGTSSDFVRVPGGLNVSGIIFGNSITGGSITATGSLQTVLMSGGSLQVCRNAQNFLSSCSSSLRYKTNIAPYFGGLSLLNQLKPITFDWKDGGMHDLGFGAEDVEKVDPLLVIYNENGQVEGVKYDRLTTILVNSVKQQQTQIEAQAAQIKQQQTQIEALKQIVCSQNPTADLCRENK